MTKRYYQFFALAILIGAPLLISALAAMVPGLQRAAPSIAGPQASPQPDYAQPAYNPESELPRALPPPPNANPANSGQKGPQAGGAFSAAPGLDPNGAAVQGLNTAGMDVSPAASAAANANPVGNSGPTTVLPEDPNEYAPPGSEEYIIKHPNR